MIDKEKVIKGLEMCIKDIECTGCPYEGECFDAINDRQFGESMMRDALALLKEQEAVEPDTDSEGTCTCGNCGETVGYYPVGCKTPQQLCKFCPECGRSVKWNEVKRHC